MKLRLDPEKIYAVALEGGGGKGAYEVGVWQALSEAGIRYGAVSGTSVGALNGAMMVMGDLRKAVDVWSTIEMTKVLNIDGQREKDIRLLLAGKPSLGELFGALQRNAGLLKEKGLDVSPLRAWIREVVDPAAVRASDIDLYITTLDVAERKGLELHVNELPEEEICDMLLASAYHPTFKQEPLGAAQKFYMDGGVFDSIPLHALIENGWKDIIAVRLPGVGVERPVRIPDDVTVATVSTKKDLGSVLLFDREQSRRDLRIGYLDACKVLYGLEGSQFYVERTLSEREALLRLADSCGRKEGAGLKQQLDRELPLLALRTGSRLNAGYYDLWLAKLESDAKAAGLDPLETGILKDTELEVRTAAAEDPVAEAEKLILASASPRRKALLTMAGISFTVMPADVEEIVPEGTPVLKQSECLALLKAETLAEKYPDRTVLGADTTVILQGQVLGKPADEEEARAFLRRLSGQTHLVVTGAAIVRGDRQESFSSVAEVDFYELTEEEIDAYVRSGEPMDKAGAYAVQGAGFRFVKAIRGDYYTVVGLPLAETVRRLEEF